MLTTHLGCLYQRTPYDQGVRLAPPRNSPSAAAETHHVSGCQFCLLLAVSQ